MKLFQHIIFPFVLLICLSCGNKPQVVQPVNSTEDNPATQGTGIFSSNETEPTKQKNNVTPHMHEVKVMEVLPTDKYIYLYVEEDDENYWIATRKQDVEVGQRYYYKNGLLKTNFESKEYNRIFEKIYLVGNIVPIGHGENAQGSQTTVAKTESKDIPLNIIPKEGSIKISEIVKNPSKYKGKQVQLTGICVKLNANIMGRNWIHLQDGSQDEYDFVITSSSPVPEGHVVTMSGILNLDKDFGAGYRYEMLVENAEIVK